VLFYPVKDRKQPGKRNPHYQDQWRPNPKKVIEEVFLSVHDEQIGLVSHGGGIAHIDPKKHGQGMGIGWRGKSHGRYVYVIPRLLYSYTSAGITSSMSMI